MNALAGSAARARNRPVGASAAAKFAWIAGIAALLSLLFVGEHVAAANEADGRLVDYFQRYLDESFRRRPLDATRLGDHRFDSLLDDPSPEMLRASRELTSSTLAGLAKAVEYAQLSPAGRIDYEIFRTDLTRSLWLADNVRPFEEDPRVYNEIFTDGVFLLLTQSTQPKAVNIRNCIARMEQIPRVAAAAKRNLKNPPRQLVETALRQVRGAVGFYQSGVFEVAGMTPQLSPLTPAARKAVEALTDYQKFLESELLPRASGEWRIGRERFVRKLELELDADISADQVLAEAEKEFARIEQEMYIVGRQLWSRYFPRQATPPDDDEGRRATIRGVVDQVALEHGTAADLVRDVKTTAEEIKQFIVAEDILRLPSPDRCRILEMPEFQRGNTIAFLNPAPPLDPRADSVYAISPPPREWDARKSTAFLEEYNRHMLAILTIHEGFPGHYVQLEYSNRHPSLIRRVLQSGVFAEGWAVYTEQMMLDQGFGGGDLRLRLQQLKFYLRTAANAILDNKMHCARMTDDEAMRLLRDRSFQSEAEARLKIVRGKQSSCQLSTYFVGRTAFYRLRQAVEREMGGAFQLARYHEAVLAHGTLPVKHLPALVRERLQYAR